MRTIILSLMMCVAAGCFAADPIPTPVPDYKALYLKEYEAARLWKEKADAMEKEASAWREKYRQIALTSGVPNSNHSKANPPLSGDKYWIRGRIISVTSEGVLVKIDATYPFAGLLLSGATANADKVNLLRPNPYAVCMVEQSSEGYVDGQGIECIGVPNGRFQYHSAGNAFTTVPKYTKVP